MQCPRALRLLLHSYRCQGKLSWAKHLAEEQLRKDLEKQAKAMLKLTLAELQFADRNGPAAKRLAKEALADFFELDMPSYEGFCLLVLAHEALAGESYGFAEKYASDALERFQDDGHSHGLGRALLTLAEVQTAAQNPAAALSAEKALEVFKFCQDEVWQACLAQAKKTLQIRIRRKWPRPSSCRRGLVGRGIRTPPSTKKLGIPISHAEG